MVEIVPFRTEEGLTQYLFPGRDTLEDHDALVDAVVKLMNAVVSEVVEGVDAKITTISTPSGSVDFVFDDFYGNWIQAASESDRIAAQEVAEALADLDLPGGSESSGEGD